LEAVADGVCRRAFSSPEAFLYELTIARALARVVVPIVAGHLRGERILDVGSGGGLVALGVARAGPHHVVGVDPSWSQVRRFARRNRTGQDSSVVRAEAENLPFPADSFDALYSSCTWKHWPDPAVGVAECVRVTRKGGRFIVIEIDGASTLESFKRFAYTSQVPVGLRKAYVRSALRTVVGVAPDTTALAGSFAGMSVDGLTISKLDDMPFLLALGTAG
jgi:ubiquinone/menaquinone biosynthesis C-methylase UbiE